ncbi:membrane protein insertion efficiency factor YidD [Nibricoccus sp. IMCC34717]|uniref:membrane protein insertion efficiency factor YidD n=1 Tax=Nibricoccus sp. IMCC34717 TaxID=3034021 RepID=UPI003850C220
MTPSLAARLALALLWLYRHTVSPVLATLGGPGSGCRFHPTCSCYAVEAIRLHGAASGSWLAARRLVRCGPWSAGGNDPVPPARPRCVRATS